MSLPIAAAFHAKHLRFDGGRIILPGSTTKELSLEHTQIISSHSGLPYEFHTLAELLSVVVDDILQNTIENAAIMENLCSSLEERRVILTPVGPNITIKRLTKCLKDANIEVEIESLQSKGTSTCAATTSGDIAIVGMSGRFPGAETLEEFWKVLEDGLDLHREVCFTLPAYLEHY